MAAMSRSSSGEATDVGIGPVQSQGSVLSWSQPSYSKLYVKRTANIDRYVSALSVLYHLLAAAV